MSLRSKKINRLKEQQELLKKDRSQITKLQSQQEALRRGLLLKKPMREDKKWKISRMKENQRVARDLGLKRQKEKVERNKILREVAKKNHIVKKEYDRGLRNMFFPQRQTQKRKRRG